MCTCTRPQIVSSLHIHLQLVKPLSSVLTAAFPERMSAVASTGQITQLHKENHSLQSQEL